MEKYGARGIGPLSIILVACVFSLARAPSPAGRVLATPAGHATALPVRFEANAGQWPEHARFRARAGGLTLFVTDVGMSLGMGGSNVSIRLAGARPRAPKGEDELATKSNFFSGSDPAGWRTGVANFASVRASGWVPGVDVVWHGGPNGIEYDLVVEPGVDASSIALEVAGADRIAIREDGALVADTTAGQLVQKPPHVLQHGRELAAHYALDGAGHVRFALEGYDAREAVLVDPEIAYSTYLGGTGDDFASAIAVDGSGNAYVTGSTLSTDLPTKSPAQPVYGGGIYDAFVAKLEPSGSALVYATYLGGSSRDDGKAIAVDANGNAFVIGTTSSSDFPVQSAFQSMCQGMQDAFVVELGASGALIHSTFLGGTGSDSGLGIAVDASGSAYVVGYSGSSDFPTKNALQTVGQLGDAFVTKLDPSGTSLVFSTLLGGSGSDGATGVAVAANGNVFVTGDTGSTDFPTKNALQASNAGGASDAFLTEISASGAAIVYSTYLGGSGVELGRRIALDASGNAYVTGTTTSTTFPTQGALTPAYAGGPDDAFVSKVAGSGSLVFSTYLGGSGSDEAGDIAIDTKGNAYVVLRTSSVDLLEKNPVAKKSTDDNVYVAKIAPSGTSVVYASYFGGSGADYGYGVAVDGKGNAFLTGQTDSTDFPTRNPLRGTVSSIDAFVLQIRDPELAQGSACKTDGECASTHCVDGVCCDTGCTGQCEACDSIGTCRPVTGSPRGTRAACAPTSACQTACDGTTTTGCTCQLAASCVDAHTSKSADGTTTDCSPYACGTSGACLDRCTSVADCVKPNVCDPNGRCVPLTSSSGCACNASAGGSDALALALVAIALVLRRRAS